MDVDDMLDMSVASVYHVAQTRQVSLLFEPNYDGMTIAADPQKFHFALRCLLDNAVRYTNSGGSVWIDAFEDGNEVVIQITDTGKGIEAHILPHIFKRFYREDQAHTTEGFGLGLPIAHAIIQRHFGHLSVKSTVGTGRNSCRGYRTPGWT
jgi:methyl-accepting chemotaxis protein